MTASAKYWEKRRDELLRSLEKDEAKLSQKMSKHYAGELKQLEKDIAYYYSKYGIDNVIEYRRLLQTLSADDARMLIERCEDFVKSYPQYAYLIPLRESIYKLNRLEGLQQSMYLQQLKIGAIEQDAFTAHLFKTAARGYKAVSGLGTAAINDDALKKLINTRWYAGKNFSDRIWDNKAKLSNFLQTDFKNGIIRGDGYDKMIKQLTQRFGVGRSDAQRLIYTEGTYIMNESAMSAFEGWYDQYKYSAIGDSHTCSVCSSLSGEVFNIKDRFSGTNFPPMHANCRCSFEVLVVDESLIEKTDKRNLAKNVESFMYDSDDVQGSITPESIYKELGSSAIGRETLNYIKTSGVKPKLEYERQMHSNRGDQDGNLITIYVLNNKNSRVATQTVIHEMTHHRYKIGECQWAEAVCFAKEKMHIENRAFLTFAEKRYIIGLVKDAYHNKNWKKGGYKNGKKF